MATLATPFYTLVLQLRWLRLFKNVTHLLRKQSGNIEMCIWNIQFLDNFNIHYMWDVFRRQNCISFFINIFSVCILYVRLLFACLRLFSLNYRVHRKQNPRNLNSSSAQCKHIPSKLVRFMVGHNRSGVRWVFWYGRSISFLHRVLRTKYLGYILCAEPPNGWRYIERKRMKSAHVFL